MAVESPEFTANEHILFSAMLDRCSYYFEWGCGESTIRAARTASVSRILSIDSSIHWIAEIQQACAGVGARSPEFVHINIGAVTGFGYPANEDDKASWPNYAAAIQGASPHLVLIDGRFRVACALRTMLEPNRILFMVHDYASRPHYHIIGHFAREIARAERLSLFQRKNTYNSVPKMFEELKKFEFDPR